MRNLRLREGTRSLTTHPDFEFVKPGNENLFIGGWGESTAGRVILESSDYAHYTRVDGAHLFLRCHSEVVRHRLLALESTFKQMALDHGYTTTMRHCTREHVVVAYENKYGRDGLE